MRRTQGHTDDLETLFARYNELETNNEAAFTAAPQPNLKAERLDQIADEFKERAATKAANWVASQLTLF